MDEQELDFMNGLLCMDPDRRLTGLQCLEHPYLAGLSGTSIGPTTSVALARARSGTSSPHMRASYTGEGTPRSSLTASSSRAGESDAGCISDNGPTESDCAQEQ